MIPAQPAQLPVMNSSPIDTATGTETARYSCPTQGRRAAATASPHQIGHSSSSARGTDSYQIEVASAPMVSAVYTVSGQRLRTASTMIVSTPAATATISSWNTKLIGAENSCPNAAVQAVRYVSTGLVIFRCQPAVSACCQASQSPVRAFRYSS